MGNTPWKPTKEQLLAAADKTLPDLIAPNLKVLFTGINPGLYTSAVGHHFARPGNRFWKVLHLAGFTPYQIDPFDEQELLSYGIGITNVVSRTTATAAEVTADEMRVGGELLRAKLLQYRPKVLAVQGMGAYRMAFNQPKATVGEQPETVGTTRLWVLPNPSGLQASYQLPDLVRLMTELREAVED